MPDRYFHDVARDAVAAALSGTIDSEIAFGNLRDIMKGVIAERGANGAATLAVTLMHYLIRAIEELAEAQGRPVYDVYVELFADAGDDPGGVGFP